MITLQVLLLWMLFTLLFGGVGASGVPVTITVLNQTNAAERWPNLANCVRCQNITDAVMSPLVLAADDAVQPPLAFFQARGVARGVEDCYALTVAFSAIRHQSSHPPLSITLQFMRDDAAHGNTPGTLFYQKTVPWATNDYMWQKDYVGMPWTYEFSLQYNELGDDGRTRFDFRSSTFLPPAQRFWFAFFCTVKQEISTSFRFNSMYWVTLNAATNSTPLSPLLYGQQNLNFLYRDQSNFFQQQWVNWTAATIVEPFFRIAPTTNNLAWRLTYTCLGVPTAAPLTITTSAPTGLIPTGTPTTTFTPTESVGAKELVETNNESDTGRNETRTGIAGLSQLELALVIGLPIGIIALAAFTLLVYRRWRKRQAVLNTLGRQRDLLNANWPEPKARPQFSPAKQHKTIEQPSPHMVQSAALKELYQYDISITTTEDDEQELDIFPHK
jgi:hypothetical protein